MTKARSIIDYAHEDNGTAMRDALYSSIHDKVMAHIESHKQQVAQNLIAQEEVEQVDEGTPEFNARASRYAAADAAEKKKEGKYSKKYPGGKEQHAKDTDAFMKRFPAPKNNE